MFYQLHSIILDQKLTEKYGTQALYPIRVK